jgi:hypothetical protein
MRASRPIPESLRPDPLDVRDDQADAAAAPANRAARRGHAKDPASHGAVRTGSGGRPRAAQGRRVNPVRRTAG